MYVALYFVLFTKYVYHNGPMAFESVCCCEHIQYWSRLVY